MKRLVSAAAVALSLFVLSPAHAESITYTFHPYDNGGQLYDINDLDHTRYYVWEISNFSLDQDVTITGATLSFTNIYDWRQESNDALYLHLLDTRPTTGLSLVRSKTGVDADFSSAFEAYTTKLFQGTDNEGGGDKFSGMGQLITPVWSDPIGGLPANNVVYDFSHLGGSVDGSGNIVPGTLDLLPFLEQYLRNGNNVSFGLDPDCHYYNEQVTLTITTGTRSVPEPGTLLLFGVGLVGLGLVRRKTQPRP